VLEWIHGITHISGSKQTMDYNMTKALAAKILNQLITGRVLSTLQKEKQEERRRT
jgi:hypothetical protein